MRAAIQWRSLGGVVTIWRGSPRTMPLGSLDVTEDELAKILRASGWKVTR